MVDLIWGITPHDSGVADAMGGKPAQPSAYWTTSADCLRYLAGYLETCEDGREKSSYERYNIAIDLFDRISAELAGEA